MPTCMSCWQEIVRREVLQAGLAPAGAKQAGARGWCETCYKAWLRAGKPEPKAQWRHEIAAYKPHSCRSCGRWMRTAGGPDKRRPGAPWHHAFGLCHTCYQHWRRSGCPPVEGFRHEVNPRGRRYEIRVMAPFGGDADLYRKFARLKARKILAGEKYEPLTMETRVEGRIVTVYGKARGLE